MDGGSKDEIDTKLSKNYGLTFLKRIYTINHSLI
jgi:hypothetical protein